MSKFVGQVGLNSIPLKVEAVGRKKTFFGKTKNNNSSDNNTSVNNDSSNKSCDNNDSSDNNSSINNDSSSKKMTPNSLAETELGFFIAGNNGGSDCDQKTKTNGEEKVCVSFYRMTSLWPPPSSHLSVYRHLIASSSQSIFLSTI